MRILDFLANHLSKIFLLSTSFIINKTYIIFFILSLIFFFLFFRVHFYMDTRSSFGKLTKAQQKAAGKLSKQKAGISAIMSEFDTSKSNNIAIPKSFDVKPLTNVPALVAEKNKKQLLYGLLFSGFLIFAIVDYWFLK